MLALLKSIIKKLFPSLYKQLINFKILANYFGQYKSIKEGRSVNAQGMPVPWYTYPCIEYLERFNFKNKSIFEFGTGFSSLFWANRAKEIASVEHNKEWFELISSIREKNQKIIYEEDKDKYIKSLSNQNKKFDIIIVDGVWREGCAKEAIRYLNEGGFIILDNSDLNIDISKMLRESNFLQIDFSGFGPMNEYCWTTSIFLRAPNAMQQDFSNKMPIGGIGKELNET